MPIVIVILVVLLLGVGGFCTFLFFQNKKLLAEKKFNSLTPAAAMNVQASAPLDVLKSTQDSRDNFLRQLLKNSAKSDIEQAAYGIIETLLSMQEFRLSYVTLLQYLNTRKQLVIVGTNVPRQYWKSIMMYSNEVHTEIIKKNLVAHNRASANDCLPYPSARDRGVCYEYYIPLHIGDVLIGSILLESRDRTCANVLDLQFFQLVADNISLVLNNILLMQQIFQNANTDNLTKLYNRNYMYHYVDGLKTMGATYSVLISDIDFFKKFNDTYGHSTGDVVLAEVARIFNNSIRADFDGAFRFGGEEFIIVFRDISPDMALQRAEYIRTLVQNTIMHSSETTDDLHVTISIGLFHGGSSREDFDLCIKRADKALYYSKEHGRNRVSEYHKIDDLIDEDKNTASKQTAFSPMSFGSSPVADVQLGKVPVRDISQKR